MASGLCKMSLLPRGAIAKVGNACKQSSGATHPMKVFQCCMAVPTLSAEGACLAIACSKDDARCRT